MSAVTVRPASARRMSAVPLVSPMLQRLAVSIWAGIWADVLLVGTLVTLAGAVRWPHLLMSPQFPSVGDTIIMALDIAQGRAFYLHDQAPYLGAPFIWLLALVYRVFGPSIEATQLLAWSLGALTVVPTYLLGREIGGRAARGVAGGSLASSRAPT